MGVRIKKSGVGENYINLSNGATKSGGSITTAVGSVHSEHTEYQTTSASLPESGGTSSDNTIYDWFGRQRIVTITGTLTTSVQATLDALELLIDAVKVDNVSSLPQLVYDSDRYSEKNMAMVGFSYDFTGGEDYTSGTDTGIVRYTIKLIEGSVITI